MNHKKTQRKPVSVRLTGRERAIVRAKAEAEGLGQGEFLRRIIVAQITDDEQTESAAEQAADAALVAAQLAAWVMAHAMIMQTPSPTQAEQISEKNQVILNQYLPSEDGDQEV